jgi:hypothetical protein
MVKSQPTKLGLSTAVEKLQKHFQDGLELIRAVKDEARLELHLGSMDAKKRWAAMESDLSKAEHEALQRAPPVVDQALKALHALRRRTGKAAAKRAPGHARA